MNPLDALVGSRLTCPQCGKPYLEIACGPSHAVLSSEIARSPYLSAALVSAREERDDLQGSANRESVTADKAANSHNLLLAAYMDDLTTIVPKIEDLSRKVGRVEGLMATLRTETVGEGPPGAASLYVDGWRAAMTAVLTALSIALETLESEGERQ